MKKNIVLLMCFTVLFLFFGCSSRDAIMEPSDTFGTVPSSVGAETTTEPTAETTIELVPELPVFEEIVARKNYIIDDICEFKLVRYELVNGRIELAHNVYRSEPDSNNNIYIDFIFDYKNLRKMSIFDEEIADGLLVYSDGYKYKARLDSYNFEFQPLEQKVLHIYFEVPKALFEDDEPIQATFTFRPNVVKYTINVDKNSLK